MKKETVLQNQIRAALCEKGCVVHRCNSGLYYTKDGRTVRCGEVGHTDLYGHRPDGRAFYLEVKTPAGTASKQQRQFITAMGSSGAIAGFARTAQEAEAVVFGGKPQ